MQTYHASSRPAIGVGHAIEDTNMVYPSSALSRRGFMGSTGATGLALGAGLIGGHGQAAAAPAIDVSMVTTPAVSVQALPGTYYLVNVRLETGFVEERRAWLDMPVITRTKTELKTLRIANGAVAAILDGKASLPADAAAFDAQGQLMLPTFRDMHIHLDKTFYGGPWEATLPARRGLADRVAQERELLPKLLPVAEERTAAMIRLMHSQGTTVCRSHCNVDPVSKLGNLEHLKASLDRYKDVLESSIIVFPQHGLLASDSVSLMREALKSGGVGFVGGVDPTSFDRAMEKSVDTTVQLALDFNVGIDIHIHEPRATAIPAFNRFMDHVEKNLQLRGKVTFSHAFSLAELSKDEIKGGGGGHHGPHEGPGHHAGQRGAAGQARHAAAGAARGRREGGLRHRQRDGLVELVWQLRHPAEGPGSRPAAIREHRVRHQPHAGLCDRLCHAA